MTNLYSDRLRTALGLAQPTGAWTNGFGYDAMKRLTNVTSQAGSFGYVLGGSSSTSTQIKKLLLSNTSYITNTYDTVARLTGTWLKKNDGTTLDSATYGYNAGNQRTTFTSAAGMYVAFTYDPTSQLKVADSSVNTEDRGYFYDTAWNLNYRTNNGTLQTFTVDNKNQLTNAPSPVNAITYDANGNLVTAKTGHDTYTYDDENRLIEWVHYRLEGPSLNDPATQFVYDGWRVIQERDINNTPTVSYTRGNDLSGSLEGAGGIGGLLGRSHGYSSGSWTNHNFYHADGNGNITYLVESSQALAASYRYDPFGNTISSSGSLADANIYRFSSKEIHVNSGFYYYGYRWYAPNLQRWLNKDPLGE